MSKPKVDLTLRQSKILNNLIAMVNRMAEKRKTDQLRNFFQKNFKRQSLPGEKSVTLGTFRHESHKKSVSVLIPGQSLGSLKSNINQSELNLKLINSGKRMNNVMTTQIDGSKTKKDEDGLPVFRDRHYSSDL